MQKATKNQKCQWFQEFQIVKKAINVETLKNMCKNENDKKLKMKKANNAYR